MLRIKLAEWLLRSAGIPVEYRVKRAGESSRHVDGRTIQTTKKLLPAVLRWRDLRVAETDKATVLLVATTHQRHGNVVAD